MNQKKKPAKKESDGRFLFVLAGALILAVIFVAVIVLSTPAEPAVAGQSDTIRIGAIYNLNGSQSSLDIPSARGARLAAELINERGGINGRPVVLTVYDGKTNTTEIVRAAKKLVDEDHVQAMIGMSDSDMVLPAAHVAARCAYRLCHLRCYISGPAVAGSGIPVSFLLWRQHAGRSSRRICSIRSQRDKGRGCDG